MGLNNCNTFGVFLHSNNIKVLTLSVYHNTKDGSHSMLIKVCSMRSLVIYISPVLPVQMGSSKDDIMQGLFDRRKMS